MSSERLSKWKQPISDKDSTRMCYIPQTETMGTTNGKPPKVEFTPAHHQGCTKSREARVFHHTRPRSWLGLAQPGSGSGTCGHIQTKFWDQTQMGRLHRPKLKWNKITSHGYGGFQHSLNNTQDTEKPQKETNEDKSEQTKKAEL